MVHRRVAVVVVRTNTTGIVSRKVHDSTTAPADTLQIVPFRLTFNDLAAAFGAFGVLFHSKCPITTGLSDIWIGARAEVQTSTIADIISIPAQSVGWLVVNSHTGKSQYLSMINHDVAKSNFK